MSRFPVIEDLTDIAAYASRAGNLAAALDMGAGQGYARELKVPHLVLVHSGAVKVAFRDGNTVGVESGKLILVMPGNFVSFTAVESSCVLVCGLYQEKQIYDRLQLAGLSRFRPAISDQGYTLPMEDNLGVFVNGFIFFLRRGFSSPVYQGAKISELLYLMRVSYPKDKLAALFYPLLGAEVYFKNFIFSHIGKVTSVNELAQLAHMSATGFRAKFQRLLGESPSDMLTRYKTDMVLRDILYTDLPLKEISEKYGFNSIYVFSRFCKRELGSSPGQLRKSGRSPGSRSIK
ncbi:MAG: helix-turn-helix transcriptional regulator [Alistipes sp.]|nr:helix-turn-helix transcriptional regulator [Alistipes sp.]